MTGSASVEWETPLGFFKGLNDLFHFELDVCATPANAKCPRYFTVEQNALKQEWKGVCWMNPPYGKEIKAFMKKAYESALAGATVVCLVPARTDTAWWHDYATHGVIKFIRGRLRFNGHKWNAPFPSAVCVFQPGCMT